MTIPTAQAPALRLELRNGRDRYDTWSAGIPADIVRLLRKKPLCRYAGAACSAPTFRKGDQLPTPGAPASLPAFGEAVAEEALMQEESD